MAPSLTLLDPARAYKLKQVLKNADPTDTYWLPWRGQRQAFPVVRIETDWVLLSLENGRTKAEQEVAAAETNDPELFSDPVSDKAQRAQAQILRDLDPTTYNELINDLKQRGQTEPGVLTAAGVLVNGNRRCVALRELGTSYMRAVVLPDDATPKEIRALEVELQIAKDFREDYSDINRLLMLERLMQEDGYTPEQVASRLRMAAKDVLTDRGVLGLMREYLASVQGLQRLGNINGTYQAFKEAYERISELRNAGQNGRADRLKNARFVGILAGTGYRELRHVDEHFAQKYAVPHFEREPVLQSLLLGPSPSAQPVDLGPLAAFSSGTHPVDDNAQLLKKMVELAAVQVNKATGDKGLSAVLVRAKAALNSAAQSALQDAKDERNSVKPSILLEEALNKITRISLEKAIAAGAFDELEFQRKLLSLSEALDALNEKFANLRG